MLKETVCPFKGLLWLKRDSDYEPRVQFDRYNVDQWQLICNPTRKLANEQAAVAGIRGAAFSRFQSLAVACSRFHVTFSRLLFFAVVSRRLFPSIQIDSI